MNFLSSYGELLSPILTLVVTVTVPIIGAAAVRLFSKMGIDIEARHREALQSALRNGALLAIEKATGVPRKATDNTSKPSIVPDIQAGVEYVQKSVPDALNKFDLGPTRIKEMILPHIQKELLRVF